MSESSLLRLRFGVLLGQSVEPRPDTAMQQAADVAVGQEMGGEQLAAVLADERAERPPLGIVHHRFDGRQSKRLAVLHPDGQERIGDLAKHFDQWLGLGRAARGPIRLAASSSVSTTDRRAIRNRRSNSDTRRPDSGPFFSIDLASRTRW